MRLSVSAVVVFSLYLLVSVVAEDSVKVVDFDERRVAATLDDNALEKVINSRPEVKDMPMIVVSIAGVARSGKSFLLNLFVSYLTYLEKNGNDNGWESSDATIEGIQWARSETPVTEGIWIWSRPFIVTKHDGRKVSVLLMDTQGMGDNTRDEKLSTLIMYLSLQLASVQMVNLFKYTTSDALSSLQLCAEYVGVDNEQQQSYDHLFQSLIFVLRDYQASDNFGEDRQMFPKIVRDSVGEDARRVASGIQNAFKDITAFNMPYPGSRITTASANSQLSVKDVDSLFLQVTKSLLRQISHLSDSHRADNFWPSGRKLLAYFKNMKRHIDEHGVPEFHTSSDALQDMILYRAYDAAVDTFQVEMKKLEETELLELFSTEGELIKILERITHDAHAQLRAKGKFNKYSETAVWRKYHTLLSDACESTRKATVEKYQKLVELRQKAQENERLAIEKEQQRKKSEEEINKLNEKVDTVSKQREQDAEIARRREAQLREENRELEERARRGRRSGGNPFAAFFHLVGNILDDVFD